MTESLPSGVLKVAEECKRLAAGVRIAITRQCMDPCAKNVARCDLSDGALNAAIDQLAALKAAPVVDVERIMALAEDLEAEAVYATRSGNLDRVRAAREALRAAVEARP